MYCTTSDGTHIRHAHVWCTALWFEHVLEAFTAQGFKQSSIDPCLLFKQTIMVVLYVDDVGIVYANESDLELLLTNLTKLGLQFTKEGNFALTFSASSLLMILSTTRSL